MPSIAAACLCRPVRHDSVVLGVDSCSGNPLAPLFHVTLKVFIAAPLGPGVTSDETPAGLPPRRDFFLVLISNRERDAHRSAVVRAGYPQCLPANSGGAGLGPIGLALGGLPWPIGKLNLMRSSKKRWRLRRAFESRPLSRAPSSNRPIARRSGSASPISGRISSGSTESWRSMPRRNGGGYWRLSVKLQGKGLASSITRRTGPGVPRPQRRGADGEWFHRVRTNRPMLHRSNIFLGGTRVILVIIMIRAGVISGGVR
jgi:hypothetical protein